MPSQNSEAMLKDFIKDSLAQESKLDENGHYRLTGLKEGLKFGISRKFKGNIHEVKKKHFLGRNPSRTRTGITNFLNFPGFFQSLILIKNNSMLSQVSRENRKKQNFENIEFKKSNRLLRFALTSRGTRHCRKHFEFHQKSSESLRLFTFERIGSRGAKAFVSDFEVRMRMICKIYSFSKFICQVEREITRKNFAAHEIGLLEDIRPAV